MQIARLIDDTLVKVSDDVKVGDNYECIISGEWVEVMAVIPIEDETPELLESK